MSDTKILGLCILIAAGMISATIVWSTKVNVEALMANSAANSESAPLATGPTSITISGPVTLAPISAPIPVTIATPNGTPIIVKDAGEKQWTR